MLNIQNFSYIDNAISYAFVLNYINRLTYFELFVLQGTVDKYLSSKSIFFLKSIDHIILKSQSIQTLRSIKSLTFPSEKI